MSKSKSFIVGEVFRNKTQTLGSTHMEELESWVVNSVKLSMICKMEEMLEPVGKKNLRDLFLVPVFNISELIARVKTQAPELSTIFYRELMDKMAEAEERIRG